MDAKNELKRTLIWSCIALTLVILTGGAVSGHPWLALGLVASGTIGLGLSVYVNKRLNAEK